MFATSRRRSYWDSAELSSCGKQTTNYAANITPSHALHEVCLQENCEMSTEPVRAIVTPTTASAGLTLHNSPLPLSDVRAAFERTLTYAG